MRISVTRLCIAPPDRIWPWLVDPHLHVRTLPSSVSQIEVRDNGDIACRVSAMGIGEHMVVRVVERDEPWRMVERRVDGGRDATTTFELSANGSGTLVTVVSEIDLPRLLAVVARSHAERGLRQELEQLDRLSSAAP